MANSTKNYKNKKRYDRKPREVNEVARDDNSKHPGNHIEWYAKSEALLNDSASLNYSQSVGLGYTLGEHGSLASDSIFADNTYYVPGIMRFDTLLVPGISKENASAVTLGARKAYSFIRHENSGAKNYDAPDLMLYFLAYDQCAAFFAWMCRLYGVARLYLQQNRYLPITLLDDMGVNANDVISNLRQLKTVIDNFAYKLSSFHVPMDMPLVARHMWMYSNLFYDRPSIKGQLYYFNPEGFYRYDELSGLGKLVLTPFVSSGVATRDFTVDDLEDYATTLMNWMLSSEDINIMSGDVLKAFGYDKCWTFKPIDENYVVMPVYDEDTLTQIHNMTFAGGMSKFTDADEINQDVSGAIIFAPTLTDNPGFSLDKIINMPGETPTPAENMRATRLSYIARAVGFAPNSLPPFAEYHIESCGTEIITACYVRTSADSTTSIQMFQYEYLPIEASMPEYLGVMRRRSIMQAFDWAPITYVVYVDDGEDPTNGLAFYPFLDFNTYTTLTSTTLRRMHDTATLSEFNISSLK